MNIYCKIFDQTGLNDNQISKVLGINNYSVSNYRKTEVVKESKVIEFMTKLKISNVEYKENNFFIKAEIKW